MDKSATQATILDAVSDGADSKPNTSATRKSTTKKKEQVAGDVANSAEKVVKPVKKMMVGQKPKGGPSEPTIIPTALQKAANEPAPSSEDPVATTEEANDAKSAFKVDDSIVYPSHGVGRIIDLEKQVIAGITNELFVIVFDQEKMKLRVPTAKAVSVGMRPLSSPDVIDKAVELLKGRARIKRTMWSRRAQEYEAKINSGDVIAVAEVVRDLYRASDQPEQSYSERQLFEQALDRFAREVAAVRDEGLDKAIMEVEASLQQKKAA